MELLKQLTNTKFTEYLTQVNSLPAAEVKEWNFAPGMLYGSIEKWWDKGNRDNHHEGVDVCLYRDKSDNIFRLKEKTLIPAIYDGIIAGIIDDYLGKSIIIEHDLNGVSGSFCTILAHVIPKSGLVKGSFVKQGEAVSEIAGTGKLRTKILPHLHISLGRATKGFPYCELDWDIIRDPKRFILHDPVSLLDAGYRVIDGSNRKKS
ncbi:MAG: M23 family metallopeptidase [Spirochaetota bacterium]